MLLNNSGRGDIKLFGGGVVVSCEEEMNDWRCITIVLFLLGVMLILEYMRPKR